MTGRFLGIKKSTILKASALFFFWAFLAFLFVSIFYLKSPEIWFFGFCLFVGSFELVKSFLFRFDTSLYLGLLLFSIGVFGFVFTYTNTSQYAGFYVALAFIFASTLTYFFTGQRFHLIFAFSTIFVSLYSLLYVKNLISSSILIAFLVPFLLLLIVEMVCICFLKK